MSMPQDPAGSLDCRKQWDRRRWDRRSRLRFGGRQEMLASDSDFERVQCFAFLDCEVALPSVTKLEHQTKHENGRDDERGVVYLGISLARSLQ